MLLHLDGQLQTRRLKLVLFRLFRGSGSIGAVHQDALALGFADIPNQSVDRRIVGQIGDRLLQPPTVLAVLQHDDRIALVDGQCSDLVLLDIEEQAGYLSRFALLLPLPDLEHVDIGQQTDKDQPDYHVGLEPHRLLSSGET